LVPWPAVLTVHHLGRSQSERIVWLCEELGIPYELQRYERDPQTRLAPPEYKALHAVGTAPVITDGDEVVLGESGAIIEYLLAKYGHGELAPRLGDPEYTNYLYWLHFANSSFQALLHRTLAVRRVAADGHRSLADMQKRLDVMLSHINQRLGEADYLAGNGLTAADIMIVFSFTTMRSFTPYDLKPYPNILAYLKRIAAREAYKRAMAKGDPGMPLLLE
jgi:glutathione S-transferase